MNSLKNKTENLKDVLKKILIFLDKLNEENFLFNLNKANELIQNSHILKKEIKEKYREEEIKLFEKELFTLAKQISSKFDNIITNKRTKLKIVSKKLILVQNQKKLLNYSR